MTANGLPDQEASALGNLGRTRRPRWRVAIGPAVADDGAGDPGRRRTKPHRHHPAHRRQRGLRRRRGRRCRGQLDQRDGVVVHLPSATSSSEPRPPRCRPPPAAGPWSADAEEPEDGHETPWYNDSIWDWLSPESWFASQAARQKARYEESQRKQEQVLSGIGDSKEPLSVDEARGAVAEARYIDTIRFQADLGAAPKLLIPANNGIPTGTKILWTQKITSPIRAGSLLVALKEQYPGKTIVYVLRDANAKEVLKVGVDKIESMPEVWRRYKNTQELVSHRQLTLEAYVIETNGETAQGIEKQVHQAFTRRDTPSLGTTIILKGDSVGPARVCLGYTTLRVAERATVGYRNSLALTLCIKRW